jgi:signal peptidase I
MDCDDMNRNPSRAAEMSVRFCLTGLVFIACLLVLQSQFRLVLVVGDSMRPTLSHGDLLLADKRAYRDRQPERGDLVVVWHHREMIVKRIVGLPGEVVEVIEGDLFVNHRLLIEREGPKGNRLNIGRGQLAQDRFAVLGDNRGLLEGQTVHAIVSKDDIVGVVVATTPTWPSRTAIPDDDLQELEPPLWSRVFPAAP